MIIEGIASWAHIQKPSADRVHAGKRIPGKYSIDLILDSKLAKELYNAGFPVKKIEKDIPGIEDAIGKPYLQIKKKAKYQDGNPTPPVPCVDAKKQEFKGLIGNGSRVKVNVNPYEYDFMGKKGITAQLRAVQVLELVEHKTSGVEEFEEEEGFISSNKDSESIPNDKDSINNEPWK